MGRKKRRSDADQQRIFCYYCDRNFGSEQTLLSHQKEKHLRCPTCNKRMISVSGMVIHSQQVHNVTVNTVPNAIAGRTSVAVDVVGMNGIPPSYFMQQSQSGPKAARLNGTNSPGAYVAQRYYAPPAQTPYSNGYPGAQPYAGAYAGAQVYSNAQAYSHPQAYGNGYGAAYGGAYGYGVQPHARTYQYTHAQPTHAPYAQYPAASQPSAQPLAHAPIVQPLSTGVPAVKPVVPVSARVATAASVPASSSAPVSSAVVSAPATVHSVTTASAPTATSPPKLDKKSQQVKVVFTELTISMEELRAKLPRYKLDG